mmetsp:Transcript_56893/g.133701  ORF Transcript_56893/g.133701 Transcript_56893/m.133701 type:complete len:358 (-) Transcript_56893:38-1111(-)
MSVSDGMRALPMAGILQLAPPPNIDAAKSSSEQKVVRLQGQFNVEGSDSAGKGDIDLDEYFFDGEAVYNRLKKTWRRKEITRVLDKRIQLYKDRHGKVLDDRIEAKFAHQSRELKLLSKLQEEEGQRHKMTAAESETAAVIENGHREFVDFAIDEVERPVTKVDHGKGSFEWSSAGSGHKVVPALAGSMKVYRINRGDDVESGEDVEFVGLANALAYDARVMQRALPPPADAFEVDFVRDLVEPGTLNEARRHSSQTDLFSGLQGMSRQTMATELTAQAHKVANLLQSTSALKRGSAEALVPFMETVRPPSSGDAALTNTPELPRSSRLDARGFSQEGGLGGMRASNQHATRRFGLI